MPEFSLSVTSLVNTVLRTGDLNGFSAFSKRGIEGIKGHQSWQNSRTESYESEVSLNFRFSEDDFSLQLQGRLDGIYNEGDSEFTLEEIKTTTLSASRVKRDSNPSHWAQLYLYAFMYTKLNNLETIQLQLVYLHQKTGEVKIFKDQKTATQLEGFCSQLISRFFELQKRYYLYLEKRNKCLQQLAFPFADKRKGQAELMDKVEEIILQRGQLLAEAPTGTGKTISVLFPALKALLASGAKKIFYLTAKTIGRKTVLDTMALLQEQGLELRTIALTAKSKICPCPDRVCSPKACKYAKGFFDRIDSAIEDILEHNIFDRRLILEYSRLHQICPFEFSLELAEHSDLIICDFNYVFAPGVYLKRFFDFNPEDYILLIDEGHNLVARGRNMFSASISKNEILQTRRKLKGYNQAIYRALGRLNRELLAWRKKCEKLEEQDNKGVILTEAIPDSILEQVGKTLAVFENEFMDYTKPKPTKDPRRITARNYYFELLKFIKINSIKGKEHVFYLEKEGRELKARLFCRDPAPFLAQRYAQIHSSVIFSATLAPLEYFRNSLGILPESTSQVLISPFPRENFLLLVNDRIPMTYKYRRQEIPRVVDSIMAMTAGKKGNYIIYFPSYGYMDKVLQVLRKQAPELDLLVQKPGMSESRREDFLAEFIANKDKTQVGCAVMGGIFSEGIDLSGDRLIGAAVLTVSLPGISLERNLIRDYFDEKYNKGFQFAYKYPGFNRVLQAAGRVIRSNKDRGVVLLIDQRFGKAHYRRYYPEHWKEYRRVRRSYELESACRLFWQED